MYNDGRICLDILDKNWSPVLDVLSVLLSLRSLLSDPNEESPANAEAAKLYKEDTQSYYIKVKECVSKSIKECEEEDNKDVVNEKENNINNNIGNYDDEVTMNEDDGTDSVIQN